MSSRSREPFQVNRKLHRARESTSKSFELQILTVCISTQTKWKRKTRRKTCDTIRTYLGKQEHPKQEPVMGTLTIWKTKQVGTGIAVLRTCLLEYTDTLNRSWWWVALQYGRQKPVGNGATVLLKYLLECTDTRDRSLWWDSLRNITLSLRVANESTKQKKFVHMLNY